MNCRCWNCGHKVFTIQREVNGDEIEIYIAICENCKTKYELREDLMEL
jgi:hypothetical protein